MFLFRCKGLRCVVLLKRRKGWRARDKTYVWCSVAEDDVGLPAIQLRGDDSSALSRGDIRDDGLDIANRSNGQQINAENDASCRHILGRHLAPAAGSCTQVHTYPRLGQKVEAFVDLDELKGSTRAKSLVLSKVVVLVLVVTLLVSRHVESTTTSLGSKEMDPPKGFQPVVMCTLTIFPTLPSPLSQRRSVPPARS